MAWAFEISSGGPGSGETRDAIATIATARARVTGRPIGEILRDRDIQELGNKGRRVRRLHYVGKPNRYRALQAQRFLARRAGERLDSALEVEFDRNGLIFHRLNGELNYNGAYTAYHPHSGMLGPVDGFARKVHPKRIGGLTVYSYKDKLSQEELEMFYAWYESTFKKKLRRPRGKALAMKEPSSEQNASEEDVNG